MRLVLHAIKELSLYADTVLPGLPAVEISFPESTAAGIHFQLGPDRYENELPLLQGDVLRADIAFRGSMFRAGWIGAGHHDSVHFRLHHAFRLDTWLVHDSPAPPNCRAVCEDSGEEGYPCVECVKGELRVRICC